MFNIKGLTEEEVNKSRSTHGNNSITHYKKNTFLNLVIESLNDPIIKILLIALGVKILFLFNDSDIYETIGIIVAIILASVISSLSEYGSEKAFEKLSNESSKISAKVIRNSKMISIPIDDVVVGDIVFLESGDKASADGEMINGSLYCDESMLSGETKEKFKEKGKDVFRGSVITSGSGLMKVTCVGNATFYGKIAKDIQEKTPESPLKNRLRVLATFISKIGYLFAFLVILSYLFSVVVIKNNFDMSKIIPMITSFKTMAPHLLYALTLGVTIIVVAVPEGLPMMITLVLSSNMKRLLKNNVLVRKLVGIESSGSLNILFSDKTGTITKGKLDVVGFVDSSSKVYKKFDDITNTKLGEILKIALVYNNASSISGNSIIGGNITDRAILAFVKSDDKSKYKIFEKQDFDSKKKFSSVSLDYEKGTTFFKGAYEIIIDKVTNCYKLDGSRSILSDKKSLIDLGDKYTKEGYIEFNVSTVVKDDVCRLIISVEDSGIGIKKDNIDKLFSKFERFDLEKNITIEGTGLGMAITKKLIELMHGNIVVQSVYGEGSKFTVAIDQRIIHKDLVELEKETESMNIENIDLSGKRVLVVDDNKVNLKVANRLLQGFNLTVELVTSGQECIDKIQNGENFDLILMDDMMPNMTGVETLKRLKTMDCFKIPTIALTANAISGMREKYLKDGFDDYLSKPIDKNELILLIQSILGK